ncbi:TPA: hypothetical protein LA827_002850 [Clostridium botulinum]|nr:hypothetical protein [Clostridium botulinum]
MREIAKKYLKEFDELEKKACNEEKKFIDGYGKKIENIFSEKCQSMFKEIENIDSISILPEYEDKLRKLELIYFLLDEKGFDYAKHMMENVTEGNKWKTEAKIRLLMMFVKRFYEVLYLLKGGLASSALDRARGMYEIAVYLEIIINNNESVSEKFLKHCNTSRLELAKCLGNQQIIEEITDQINDFNDDDFYKKNNGWAKELFPHNTRGISFKNLADITKFKQYYFNYKIACLSTHATIIDSVQGIELDKGSKGKNIWNTGASKNGFEFVFSMLFSCSCEILIDSLESKSLSNAFILVCIKEIGSSNKKGN